MLQNIENQFMFSNAIMVVPVLEAGMKKVSAFFPNGTWVNAFDWKTKVVSEKGAMVNLTVSDDNVLAYIAPGTIMPFQDNSDGSIMNTDDLLKKPLTLVVNLDVNKAAHGHLFIDDGLNKTKLYSQQFF